jgi:hypothetical protein
MKQVLTKNNEKCNYKLNAEHFARYGTHILAYCVSDPWLRSSFNVRLYEERRLCHGHYIVYTSSRTAAAIETVTKAIIHSVLIYQLGIHVTIHTHTLCYFAHVLMSYYLVQNRWTIDVKHYSRSCPIPAHIVQRRSIALQYISDIFCQSCRVAANHISPPCHRNTWLMWSWVIYEVLAHTNWLRKMGVEWL